MHREFNREGQERLCITVTSSDIKKLVRDYMIEHGYVTEEELDRGDGMHWIMSVGMGSIKYPLDECRLIIHRIDRLDNIHEMRGEPEGE